MMNHQGQHHTSQSITIPAGDNTIPGSEKLGMLEELNTFIATVVVDTLQ